MYLSKTKIVWMGILSACIAEGTPSGLRTLPTDVQIPKVNGRTLPVELLPAQLDNRTIYVKPLTGQFVSQGVVKSPLTNCGLVSEELKISEINTKARVDLAKMLRQAQLDNERNQEELKKYVRDYEALFPLVEPLQKQKDEAEAEKKEALLAIKSTDGQIQEIRELMIIEKDSSKLESMQKQISVLDEQVTAEKTSFVAAGKRARTASKQLSELEIRLAAAKGRKSGLEKTLSVQIEEVNKIQGQIESLQAASETVLKKYSERVGGYTTYVSDFAPSSYLEELKNANPNYAFLYVPSVTASVEATIPESVNPESALAGRIGTLILNSKWSDAERARMKKAFRKSLLEPHDKVTNPVEYAQTHLAELESALTGTKFLSLELSILGYCALKEPASLKSEFIGGSEDTFKLALYYTYPMNYELRVSGTQNQKQSLYELYKTTKSSSWFGLSKKQKQEHVRNMSSSDAIKVKVEPIGMVLSPEESMKLTSAVKEQLHYMSIERFLDKSNALPAGAPAADPGQLGAKTVGARLMLIPNPYAFWGGVILTGLSEMFGSSSSESITEITNQSTASVNYESGFTFLIPGELTIGDLKQAKVLQN